MKMTTSMKHKIGKRIAQLMAAGLTFQAALAQAVTDVTAITSAKTDLLAYAAELLVLGIAVWAAMKVVRMFNGK